MPNDRTIIDVLEDVLGVPFDPRWTKQISIDMPTAHRLAQAVRTFYQAFRLPEKDRGEMRPYLTTSYKTGSDLLSEFVSFKRDQKFTPSSDAYLLAFLKPFLLYSHGISFYDPLPWLLDFFAHRSDADFIKARLPHVTRLLLEYVKIADLIRNRVVVPVSNETFGFYAQNMFVLSGSEKREIAANSRFPEPAEFLNLLGSKVKEQLWLNQRMEDRIDLYFPNDLYVPILQGLLRAASRRYTSREINEPFAAGILADLASLDTSQISIADIISIRSEHAFDEYRRTLQRILQRLQDRQGMFSDLESEFAVAAREEMAEYDDKIKQLTKKSNVLRDMLQNLDRVLIGGVTGSLGGLLAGSPEIAVLGAAAGAAGRSLYDIVRGAWTASPSSPVRTSLRHHFLVLAPPKGS